MGKRFRITGWDSETAPEHNAVGVDMWYDRSRREWVIYAVDEEGTQYGAARYGFSKREAQEIKADIEAAIEKGEYEE